MEGGIEKNHECPVCFELPDSEIYQCHDGHVLCAACYFKLIDEESPAPPPKCPQCRVPLEPNRKIRNRGMETMLDNMSFPCPHRQFGCPALCKRTEIRDHSKNCKFANSVKLCEMLGYSCKHKMDLSNVEFEMKHLSRKHQFKMILKSNEAKLCLLEWNKAGVPAVDISWTPVIFKLRGRQGFSYVLVYVTTNKPSGSLSVRCMLLQNSGAPTSANKIEANFNIFATSTAVENYCWQDSPVTNVSRQTKQLSDLPVKSVTLESLASHFVCDNTLTLVVRLRQLVVMGQSPPELHGTGAGGGGGGGGGERERVELFPARKGKDFLRDFQCGACEEWIVGVVPVKYSCLDCPRDFSICQNCIGHDDHDYLEPRTHQFAMLLNRPQEHRLRSTRKCMPWLRRQLERNPPLLVSTSRSGSSSCSCDGCGLETIRGTLYKCLFCPEKYLCQACVDRRVDFPHIFAMIRNSEHEADSCTTTFLSPVNAPAIDVGGD